MARGSLVSKALLLTAQIAALSGGMYLWLFQSGIARCQRLYLPGISTALVSLPWL